MKGRLGYRKTALNTIQMYFEIRCKNGVVKLFWIVPLAEILSEGICKATLHIKVQLCRRYQSGAS